MAIRSVQCFFLSAWAVGALAAVNSTIPALNPQLTSNFTNFNGPVIPYNGSGDVPSLLTLSPDPAPLPPLSTSQIIELYFTELEGIQTEKDFTSNCTKCVAATEIFHLASLTLSVDEVVGLLIRACHLFKLNVNAATCESEYSGTGNVGPYYVQLFQKMSLTTQDFQAYCHYIWSFCDAPKAILIDESEWFSPKPQDKMTAPEPSGETFTVLHFSDWHLDPRYDIGSEANCTQGMCCRIDSTNSDLRTTSANASLPASRFGDFICDTPADLGLSAFANMHEVLNISALGFSIFTGDLISHDPDDQQSIAYVEYEERISFETFKAQLGNIPLYSTLGNHDSIPSGMNTPNNIRNDSQANAMSWNYDLLSSLWTGFGWINDTTAQFAATHYGAYATNTPQGLKIISINSDFFYTPNIFNFYNYTNPDNSGIFKFLISELDKSEKIGQRVWIIFHVPTGGGSATANPSALFMSVVRRYSPATIAGIFNGHTHQDQKIIYYDGPVTNSSIKNTTNLDFKKPLNVAWVCPSIAPRTNYNAGWTYYEVDAKTFEIVNSKTYFANISNTLQWSEPEWGLEYDTRATYDPQGTWPAQAPLNATFWDIVTTKMMNDTGMLDRYSFLQTKSSAVLPICETSKCHQSAICQIRAGTAEGSAGC